MNSLLPHLVYDLPIAIVALLVVGGTFLSSLLLLVIFHRLLPVDLRSAHNDVAGFTIRYSRRNLRGPARFHRGLRLGIFRWSSSTWKSLEGSPLAGPWALQATPLQLQPQGPGRRYLIRRLDGRKSRPLRAPIGDRSKNLALRQIVTSRSRYCHDPLRGIPDPS